MCLGPRRTYEWENFLVHEDGGLLVQNSLNLSVQRLFTSHRHKGRLELFRKRLVDADKVETIVEG